MDGVINIYKEAGYTSFHVIAVLRHLLGEKKIGHTGTLDPDAEGVLPVCVGKATKLVGRLTDTDKTYQAVMLLGKQTDTQDISGNILQEMDMESIRKLADKEKIMDAFNKLCGTIYQIPPMYSALKVDGVKLVDAARKGIEIERESREVTVYGYSDIDIDIEAGEIAFTVECSKGTYVRTICEDLGNMIGIPSCLKSLKRTRAAGLGTDSAITLKQAQVYADEGTLVSHIIPTDRFLSEYDYIIVSDDAVSALVHGNYLYEDDLIFKNAGVSLLGAPAAGFTDGIFRIYDKNGTFYALYRFDDQDKCYKCEKMFK